MNPCWQTLKERHKNGHQTSFISFGVIIEIMYMKGKKHCVLILYA